MRGAPSKSGSNARVPESANPAHPSRTLENPQKSWMHPCVRCVSELLARCVASQPRNLAFRVTDSGMILLSRSGFPGGGLGAPCDHAFDCVFGREPCRERVCQYVWI